MRYRKFKIENFKGIKSTEIDLRSMTGANVFPLVGLNESGKTTILEAIHSFAPDYRSRNVTTVSKGKPEADAASQVPRHLIAKFTGEISISAEIETTRGELQDLKDYIPDEIVRETTLDIDLIPDVITITKSHIFEKGDYKETVWRTDFPIMIRTGKQRKFRTRLSP